MKTFLSKLFGNKSNRTSVTARNHRFRPQIEGLEQRMLMAASINLAAGVLTIVGTDSRDKISIRYESPDNPNSDVLANVYDFNGNRLVPQGDYRANQVTSIKAYGLGEDDLVSNATDIISTLDGGSGKDVLKGGGKNDTLIGGAGDDLYLFNLERIDYPSGGGFGTAIGHHANLGTDTVIEAAKLDRDKLDFGGMPSAVRIDLAKTSVQTVCPNVLGVTLTSNTGIEDVGGSFFADRITGNARDNKLDGGLGADTFVFSGSGQLGSDEIMDTDTNNVLDFSAYGSTLVRQGITVDLASTGQQTVSNLSTRLKLVLDSASAIDTVFGSAYADTIKGNDLNNFLHGNAGDDILEGRGGMDTLKGGAGNDTLDGGVGDADILWGGAGSDKFRRDMVLGTNRDAGKDFRPFDPTNPSALADVYYD